jgi:hypothetical protein
MLLYSLDSCFHDTKRINIMRMKCAVCKEYIDPKYGFVYSRKEKPDGSFSKRKTYEHIRCSGVIQ